MTKSSDDRSGGRVIGGSIRFRLTALATLVVAIVLALTAIALLSVQRHELTANLDRSLDQRADVIADGFAAEVPTTPIPTNDTDHVTQLVTLDGEVLAGTTNITGTDPVADPPSGDNSQTIRTRDDLPVEDDTYRILSRRVDTADGPAILHVAENSDDLNDAIRSLTTTLGLAIPAVVAFLAGLMWWLTGRTLGPVDDIRAEVDAIGNADTTQRIQVPARDDEIARLATTMNRMLDRLTEATERQRRFVADAAHELRTPIARIRTTVDVDLAQPEDADPTATYRSIRDDTVGLQHLIDDLLHLARSDAGQPNIRRVPVDLDDIVMQEIREQREVRPEVRIDAAGVSAAHLEADHDHLTRAVRNLLDNATRHAVNTVSVSLHEGPSHIELSISDDGTGVPSEERDRIFERFARIGEARDRDDGGTGLGLAITRDIIEGHGGSIRVDQRPGGGARFVVRLPTEG